MLGQRRTCKLKQKLEYQVGLGHAFGFAIHKAQANIVPKVKLRAVKGKIVFLSLQLTHDA